jgi:hypothetical protein
MAAPAIVRASSLMPVKTWEDDWDPWDWTDVERWKKGARKRGLYDWDIGPIE